VLSVETMQTRLNGNDDPTTNVIKATNNTIAAHSLFSVKLYLTEKPDQMQFNKKYIDKDGSKTLEITVFFSIYM
jgi:uncharacterized membrane protein YfhO